MYWYFLKIYNIFIINFVFIYYHIEQTHYYDYASIDNTTIENIKSSDTLEYAFEMFFYLNSYYINPIGFQSYSISWDMHSKIRIIGEKPDTLKVECYPIHSKTNNKFNSNVKDTESSIEKEYLKLNQ